MTNPAPFKVDSVHKTPRVHTYTITQDLGPCELVSDVRIDRATGKWDTGFIPTSEAHHRAVKAVQDYMNSH